jgi:hypothetical protein
VLCNAGHDQLDFLYVFVCIYVNANVFAMNNCVRNGMIED